MGLTSPFRALIQRQLEQEGTAGGALHEVKARPQRKGDSIKGVPRCFNSKHRAKFMAELISGEQISAQGEDTHVPMLSVCHIQELPERQGIIRPIACSVLPRVSEQDQQHTFCWRSRVIE
eukprot:scaffold1146_cov399-Prasinococcus_capsulatus_cf.AAC.5